MWQQVVGKRGELFALGFLQVNSFVLPPPPLNSCPPFVSRLVAIRLIVVVQQGSPFPAGKEKRSEIQSRIKRTRNCLSLLFALSKRRKRKQIRKNAIRENMLNRANSDCELCGIEGSAI